MTFPNPFFMVDYQTVLLETFRIASRMGIPVEITSPVRDTVNYDLPDADVEAKGGGGIMRLHHQMPGGRLHAAECSVITYEGWQGGLRATIPLSDQQSPILGEDTSQGLVGLVKDKPYPELLAVALELCATKKPATSQSAALFLSLF